MEIEIIRLSELNEKKNNLGQKIKNDELYKILYFESFKGQIFIDFLPINLKVDSLLFLNKRTDLNFKNIESVDGKVILFSDAFFNVTEKAEIILKDSLLFNELFSTFNLDLSEGYTYFKDLLFLMASEINNYDQVFKLEILQNLLFSFLLLAERERKKQLNFNEKQSVDLYYALLFKRLVDENFKKNRLLSFYASQLEISKIYLNEVTLKTYGKMAKQIIDDKTMIEAKRLLVNTTEEIQKISFDLGFDQPTYLSKFFRRNKESSPGDFRKKQGTSN